MKGTILVVNCGSSSVKCSLFDNDEELKHASFDSTDLNRLKDQINAFLDDLDRGTLVAIGHRIVHGGPYFLEPRRLTDEVMKRLTSLDELAPLHNILAIQIIDFCFAYFSKEVPQFGVFDTSFFRSMPQVSRHYALPEKYSHERYSIQRYGFHGTSHAFLWESYITRTQNSSAKVITLHLGAGCSATAIDSGVPLDTSMGFTPLEGLVMATRTGDIDAAVVEYLCRLEKKSPKEILDLFNYESGLLGVSGSSSDMEELVKLYGDDAQATLAIDLFVYRIVKYVGAYMAVLGGLDAIIFSAGIGENSPQIRKMVVERLSWYGMRLDEEANSRAVKLARTASYAISHHSSTVALFVIATDENLAIMSALIPLLTSDP